MQILPKLIYGFNIIPIKIPAGFSMEDTDKSILKFLRKGEGTSLAKMIMKKEEES